MKKLLFIITAAIMLFSCERTTDDLTQDTSYVVSADGGIIEGQYVVLLTENATTLKSTVRNYQEAQAQMHSEMQKILQASGISAKEPLQLYVASTEGFAVKLSKEEALELGNNPKVLGVWPDKLVVLAKPSVPTPLPAEVVPPGISRVGGGATYTGTRKAWIIDTGIDLDHPDLNVDVASGKTFVSRTTTPDDDNGHGSHCAGIVAAIDNTVGVVGVAAGAKVVPVKVLDKRGSGAMSTIIAGVDYVTANGLSGDAVNMSLGGGVYDPLDLKVIAMGAKGLFVALAAGNETDDANNHSPARANGVNIYTVSACDKLDVWASFSNFGNPPVDFCAPGVSILSTYKGGALATMSGTSMAAPHMCGVLLATAGSPDSDGYVINDPDGNPDPIVHE
jgi:subtilisin family serine protease